MALASVATTSPRRTSCPAVTRGVTGSYVDLTAPTWSMLRTPLPATIPANATLPSAGANTGVPTGAPRSTPRCPASHRCAGGSKPATTGCGAGIGQPHRPTTSRPRVAGGAGSTGPGPFGFGGRDRRLFVVEAPLTGGRGATTIRPRDVSATAASASGRPATGALATGKPVTGGWAMEALAHAVWIVGAGPICATAIGTQRAPTKDRVLIAECIRPADQNLRPGACAPSPTGGQGSTGRWLVDRARDAAGAPPTRRAAHCPSQRACSCPRPTANRTR